MTSPTSRTTELARKLSLLYQIVETNVRFEKKEAVGEELSRCLGVLREEVESVARLRQQFACGAPVPAGYVCPAQMSLSQAFFRGWNARAEAKTTAMVRKDLFNLADILVLTDKMTIAIQATTGSNLPARKKKINTEARANAITWLSQPSRKLQIWGWRELEGGKLKWQPRIMEVVLVAGKLEFMEYPGTADNLRDARLAWGLLI